ncbi:MAG TPA: hypothetical protein PKN95_00200 [Verrucomicrobiota bacterium]|nr:hypothetical protein [Verrucomicrobiota bacterium]HNT15972.1 hypothetical protein [Verrucomicrobiota bacterium]
MKIKYCLHYASLALGLALSLSASGLLAQGSVFTYQGRLTDGTNPASGSYDIRAQLYNRAIAGQPGDAQIGGTLEFSNVAVTNGLLTLSLDFGAGPFNGEARWLQLVVRTNGGGAYTTLTPRQALTAAPYAILSGNLSGALATASLPSGGNWALSSTLTLDTSTLAIDPINNRVGIGTASPTWPLHLSAGQSVARLDSTANVFGSVLELRNNTASPIYLGAINFNNAASTYPGQIGYLGTDAFSFRTAGAERMHLDNRGQLDVTSADSEVGLNVLTHYLGIPLPTAIRGTCDSSFGTAVFGSSANGTAIYGTSANGLAGSFSGAVNINYASPFNKAQLRLRDPSDTGWVRLRLQTGTKPFWDFALGGENSLRFYADGNGDVMSLNTNGTLFVKVLTITGGADIAEPFRMSEANLAEGSVVVIDEAHPGQLKLSTEPYDRRVAGVISGAGGVSPGLSLQQKGRVEGDQQVALTGRVYVQADTSNGPIKPGDLLTTSAQPGHAMKVTDHARAQGAILGKAMTSLKEGTGLVLVLVTLQ